MHKILGPIPANRKVSFRWLLQRHSETNVAEDTTQDTGSWQLAIAGLGWVRVERASNRKARRRESISRRLRFSSFAPGDACITSIWSCGGLEYSEKSSQLQALHSYVPSM